MSDRFQIIPEIGREQERPRLQIRFLDESCPKPLLEKRKARRCLQADATAQFLLSPFGQDKALKASFHRRLDIETLFLKSTREHFLLDLYILHDQIMPSFEGVNVRQVNSRRGWRYLGDLLDE